MIIFDRIRGSIHIYFNPTARNIYVTKIYYIDFFTETGMLRERCYDNHRIITLLWGGGHMSCTSLFVKRCIWKFKCKIQIHFYLKYSFLYNSYGIVIILLKSKVYIQRNICSKLMNIFAIGTCFISF